MTLKYTHLVGRTITGVVKLPDAVAFRFDNGDILRFASYCGCDLCATDYIAEGNPDNAERWASLVDPRT